MCGDDWYMVYAILSMLRGIWWCMLIYTDSLCRTPSIRWYMICQVRYMPYDVCYIIHVGIWLRMLIYAGLLLLLCMRYAVMHCYILRCLLVYDCTYCMLTYIDACRCMLHVDVLCCMMHAVFLYTMCAAFHTLSAVYHIMISGYVIQCMPMYVISWFIVYCVRLYMCMRIVCCAIYGTRCVLRYAWFIAMCDNVYLCRMCAACCVVCDICRLMYVVWYAMPYGGGCIPYAVWCMWCVVCWYTLLYYDVCDIC